MSNSEILGAGSQLVLPFPYKVSAAQDFADDVKVASHTGSIEDKLRRTEETIAEDQPSGLPTPTGYRILIALPEIAKQYESGLVKADQTVRNEEVSSVIGFVLEMGADCYSDKDRFPHGPWCKKGDFVLLRAYSGTRFKLRGKEFRLINDDSVEAVVDDPRGYSLI